MGSLHGAASALENLSTGYTFHYSGKLRGPQHRVGRPAREPAVRGSPELADQAALRALIRS